jgi:hypothetical protein
MGSDDEAYSEIMEGIIGSIRRSYIDTQGIHGPPQVVRKTTERVKTNALPQSNAFNIPADGF